MDHPVEEDSVDLTSASGVVNSADAGTVMAAEKFGVAGPGDETFDEINVGFIRLGVLAVGVGGSSFGTGIGVILFGVLFSAVASGATGVSSGFL